MVGPFNPSRSNAVPKEAAGGSQNPQPECHEVVGRAGRMAMRNRTTDPEPQCGRSLGAGLEIPPTRTPGHSREGARAGAAAWEHRPVGCGGRRWDPSIGVAPVEQASRRDCAVVAAMWLEGCLLVRSERSECCSRSAASDLFSVPRASRRSTVDTDWVV